MEREYSLRTLKEEYREIQERYSLPLFKEMNEDFGIEKIAESESELLIREVRKYVSDKFANYLRFIEALLNPVNVQMFVYSIVKSLGENEKEKLKEIYKALSVKEINLIKLDLEFSETAEAEFIKDSFKIWQELKKDLLKIIDEVNLNLNKKSELKSKNYFG